MLDSVAEEDEVLLEKYLGGEELTIEEVQTCIRRATIGQKIVPVLCGSAFRNLGVQPLLDAVVAYLPSPLDIDQMVGINPIMKKKKSYVTAMITNPSQGLYLSRFQTPILGTFLSSVFIPACLNLAKQC